MAYKTAKCPIKDEETSEPCNREVRYRPGSWDYALKEHIKAYHWQVNEILKEMNKLSEKLGEHNPFKEPDDNKGGES